MEKDHPESNAEFPFAIIQKGRVVALVKLERDARFIAKSQGRISSLEMNNSSLTLQRLGRIARDGKSS
jgi:hypothetical protein